MEAQTDVANAKRTSIDLAAYPDLIVVYLGYRATNWRSTKMLFAIGRDLRRLQTDKPDGLLAHEGMMFGWRHVGMRQYWRDLASLEAFTRSNPHKAWWRALGRDPGGAGFWHETYRRGGGMEALYLNMPPFGFATFAQARAPVGPFMSARGRLAA